MSTCKFSNSDLQQIILDDDLLFKLVKTANIFNQTTYEGGGLHSGDAFVYDEDGNSYPLYFQKGDSPNTHRFAIGLAVREFTLDDYKLWTNMLIQCSICNDLTKQIDIIEKDSKRSWWSKLWN